ncbi:hypothetical protein D3H54_06240 [Mycobacterium sp. ELW1]|nr:hypothetical protein D3H54_06240 [Mycobacterium sp. ELW1]
MLGAWAEVSAIPGSASCWVHNAIVVSGGGEIIGFHGGRLVAFDPAGRLLRTVETDLTEGHGVTVVEEGGEELLWVSDPGFVFTCGADEDDPDWRALFGAGVRRHPGAPRVVKMTLDGQIRSELPIPPVHPDVAAGPMGPYCPCGVAVDEERLGGSGDLWVADGYGSSVLHRFDKDGNHVSTLTGTDAGGPLLCPHAAFIDRRRGKAPELYIADRLNTRVVVYDMDGRYVRSFGEAFLSSPSDFTQWGDLLVIAELYGRLVVVDDHDNFVGYLGAEASGPPAQSWPQRPGWPNDLDTDGRPVPPHLPEHDRFNSPHSVACDADGNLYVSEWLIGGRYSKLIPKVQGC